MSNLDATPTADSAESLSTVGLGAITREEWVRRYAQRVRERAGPGGADAVAAIGADEYERNEHAAGNAVVWWGGPSGENNTPEDEADEELSYWTDDGEG